MYADFHLHSSFSSDSESPMDAMIKKGISLGLEQMCFTEHMDFDFPPGELDFLVDMPSYYKKWKELQVQYKEQIDLRFGIELGLQPQLVHSLPAFSDSYPFDFIIGSTHLADGHDPYSPDFFKGRSEKAAYHRYFECLLHNLQSFSCMDVCGHIDYVVRYGPSKNSEYDYSGYADILDEILKLLVDKNIGLECNTAGFKYGLGHPNPTEDVLSRYRELGGEILTLGSDAHKPDHLAYAFRKTGELLKSCGFQYYTVFEKRIPRFLPL